MREVNTVDLFCGAGGAETGLSLALRDLGLAKRGLAINHWQVAVDTMRINHKDTETLNMDISSVVPSEVAKARRIDILWASPTCTHHSRAKGGKPLDNQLRAQPELVLTWLDQLNVVDLCIENVPEFVEWGPLLASGRPDPKRKGNCFRAWCNSIEARGYKVDWRILNCADYGDATTRRRFFLRARKSSYIGRLGPIVWPEQTHTGDADGDLFGLKPWRGVIECLDLSDVGTSVLRRKKPLSANTMRRIVAGLRKYYGGAFQLDFLGSDSPEDNKRLRSLSEPIPAQPTANRTAVCRPIVVRLNKGCDATDSSAPLPTVTAGAGHYMVVSPVVFDFFRGGGCSDAGKPLPAQTTKARCAMLSPLIMDMSHPAASDAGRVTDSETPMSTQTGTRNHSAAFPVVDGGRIVDVYIRMLKPSELAAAHSFPSDYVLTGTVADKVRQIGNSVPVETARAICREIFRTRKTGRTE